MKQDSEEHAKARQPILEELKAELEALAEKKKAGASDFLTFVYATHAPKGENAKRMSDETLRKQLLKACTHYHPDANSVAKGHQLKWTVLCEEITKILTYFYELTKGE